MKYDQHTHTHRGTKAHWLGTKARFGKLDAVCRDRLKVPVDWPEVTAVFTDWSKMKIAETLSMAGDRGAYVKTRKAKLSMRRWKPRATH